MRVVTKIMHNIVPLYFLIYVYRFYENYRPKYFMYHFLLSFSMAVNCCHVSA